MTVSTFGGATSAGQGRLIALRAARLFDGVGAMLVPAPVVLIEGGTIRGLGGEIPPGATVIDLSGATLLPGLIDTHVHLAFDASPNPAANLASRQDEQVMVAMESAARAALRGGVTTVRDLGDRGYLSLGLRGREDLPTILAAGPPITTPPGGHCYFLGGTTEPTASGIRAAVRDHAERGVDVIKVMASGGAMTAGSREDIPQFTLEVLRAAVDEAHRLGLPITAHAHAVAAIADAVAAGFDGLEHVTFWTEDGVAASAALIRLIAQSGIAVGATVGVVPIPGMTLPPAVATRWPAIMANGRRLHEAGALMVAGTDAGVAPVKPHDVVRYAPAALCQLGYDQAEALRVITSVAARVCGLGQRKGRIAPGFDADILAVDGDPISDSAALHRIRSVYVRGTPVPTVP
jgi:imidazolonepropionase-like amidohydrolase